MYVAEKFHDTFCPHKEKNRKKKCLWPKGFMMLFVHPENFQIIHIARQPYRATPSIGEIFYTSPSIILLFIILYYLSYILNLMCYTE